MQPKDPERAIDSSGGQRQNRTADTRIFSPLKYLFNTFQLFLNFFIIPLKSSTLEHI
ncbi:Uncharacterised protein [Legionella pneumophila]|nr:Uncharacterised protein [Legionella pneumophila]CZJ08575.1 Uncharacterised protein [Legionella pneumophila]CZJ31056.1 Uncharacterised protein [Legionella pneumophila]